VPKNAKRVVPRAIRQPEIPAATIAELVGRLCDLPASADSDDLVAAIGEHVAAVPAAARELGRVGDDPAIAALEALLDLPAFALPAVEALGHVRDEVAVRLLEQVAAVPSSKEVGKAARRALHALASVGLSVEAPRLDPDSAVFQPLSTDGVAWSGALISPIDGEGSRSLLVGQKRLPTGAASAIAVLSETLGMPFFQVSPQTHRQLDKEWQIFLGERPDTLAQEIPFDYAQWLLAEAAQLTAYVGNPLSEDYTAWLEFAGRHPADVSPAFIYAEVGVDAETPPVVSSGQAASLLDEIELAPWSLPIDAVSSYSDELVLARNSPIILSEAAEVSREYQIGARAADHYFTSEQRQGYRRRLEETALLLHRSDRTAQAQAALASAIALGDASLPPSEIPFAVTLALRTLEVGAVLAAPTREVAVEPGEILPGASGIPVSR
jgi:hypothetical protein